MSQNVVRRPARFMWLLGVAVVLPVVAFIATMGMPISQRAELMTYLVYGGLAVLALFFLNLVRYLGGTRRMALGIAVGIPIVAFVVVLIAKPVLDVLF